MTRTVAWLRLADHVFIGYESCVEAYQLIAVMEKGRALMSPISAFRLTSRTALTGLRSIIAPRILPITGTTTVKNTLAMVIGCPRQSSALMAVCFASHVCIWLQTKAG